jgi:eukaryotic-like serine/threonine-protein kinase
MQTVDAPLVCGFASTRRVRPKGDIYAPSHSGITLDAGGVQSSARAAFYRHSSAEWVASRSRPHWTIAVCQKARAEAISTRMLHEGLTVGRYQLIRELGRGGMGIVFEASHTELDSRAAVKIIEPSLADRRGQTERFIREARAAARTRHLHAVNVYDLGTHDDLLYIVMELLDGETLAAMLARAAPLPPPRIAELFVPVLSAVAAAHDAGVIHRDLKPSNIVLARRGGRIVHPVVTDFGISKLLSDGCSAHAAESRPDVLTGSHAVLGTIHYMAPELTRSAGDATPLSDQYSIGVMLYEAATGRRPFTGSSPYELMRAVVKAACERPRSLNADVPASLEAVIQRAMSPNPCARYSSLRALGAALLTHASATTWSLWGEEFHADSGTTDSTHVDCISAGSASAGSSSIPATSSELLSDADSIAHPAQAREANRVRVAGFALAAIVACVAIVAGAASRTGSRGAQEERSRAPVEAVGAAVTSCAIPASTWISAPTTAAALGVEVGSSSSPDGSAVAALGAALLPTSASGSPPAADATATAPGTSTAASRISSPKGDLSLRQSGDGPQDHRRGIPAWSSPSEQRASSALRQNAPEVGANDAPIVE